MRFQSAGWSELETGETTLALHLASAENPAGTCQLGFGVPNIDRFYADKKEQGIEFITEPTERFVSRMARFLDSERSKCSVSGK